MACKFVVYRSQGALNGTYWLTIEILAILWHLSRCFSFDSAGTRHYPRSTSFKLANVKPPSKQEKINAVMACNRLIAIDWWHWADCNLNWSLDNGKFEDASVSWLNRGKQLISIQIESVTRLHSEFAGIPVPIAGGKSPSRLKDVRG